MTISRFLRSLVSQGKVLSHGYRREAARTVVTTSSSTSQAAAVATAEVVEAEFPVGREVSGFVVREVQEVPELHLTALRLQHQATGADYLHIARADPNNVFCVGFRTTPMDSTGVPHILEHTVLCGSEKFPCRDPFFKMLNRSLSTFMNAMTGCDYTIYPFSTQHPVDFRNLMSVYMDAVFKPNLSELDFLQEGWRLEHQDIKDQSSPIVFKGVVFNEMKGVFADSQRLFMQKLLNGILPSHTYGVVSGGDPLVIPQLTWEQLKQFHAYHYHPSNARFFTYGDQPLANHLEFIQDNYLSHYNKIDPNTEVPEEPSWKEPRSAHVACGIDPMANAEVQSSIVVSYKLVDITDTFETFVLAILGELLTSGPNAPFYKALLEPGLGSSFSPSSGYDGHTRSSTFTVGLQGVKDQDIEKIKAVIEETFDGIIEEGFPSDRVESVLHNIELSLKHQTSSFGLSLAMNLTPLWNLDGDPIDGLLINNKITKFRKYLAENPKFLQQKVREYFKENPHKYTLTMAPQEGYEENLQSLEEAQLKERIAVLTPEERSRVWQLGHTLGNKQEEEEDLSCLPTLQVSDIPRNVTPVPVTVQTLGGGVEVQACDCPTNDLTYFSAVLSTRDVSEELRPLVPLLCGVLTRMGAGDMDFRQLDQAADLVSGGLSVSPHTCFHPIDVMGYEEAIVLSSHSLNTNLQKTLDLWSSIFSEAKFNDLQRFNTLVSMIATEQANSLVYSGHQYAMTAAAASTGHVSSLAESWGGLSQLRRMKALSEAQDLTPTLESLQVLARQLLGRQGMRVAINTTPNHHDTALHILEGFLKGLDGTPAINPTLASIPQTFSPHTCKTHHVFPFPINFASKAFPGVPYAHPDAGALRVLARVMFRFLHREIREKGGAYGGGAKAGPGGPFGFYSYRDPHSTQTLATFDAAVEWVLSGGFSERDVAEAKLGVFQAVDAPVSPGAMGRRRFFSHITDELFADHRRLVLDVVAQDLVKVARTYLRDGPVEGACLIGPQNVDLDNDPFWSTVHG
ncbi:Presequence protease, mitochondrial [Chionoecetes opilio]|uniref:Presequence protease, mitochondrial n=1 Tax=Chionoecetes opilio TaxID=41210 RepID=A0A8J4XVQ1_CHIOP|nr:Presequence protease, mitochondrial [Chionoecetes opilio]